MSQMCEESEENLMWHAGVNPIGFMVLEGSGRMGRIFPHMPILCTMIWGFSSCSAP